MSFFDGIRASQKATFENTASEDAKALRARLYGLAATVIDNLEQCIHYSKVHDAMAWASIAQDLQHLGLNLPLEFERRIARLELNQD